MITTNSKFVMKKGSRDTVSPYKGHKSTSSIGFSDTGHFLIQIKYPEGGGYFTSIPISPKEYRKKHPTNAGFTVMSDKHLIVYDDWGNYYSFTAGKRLIKALAEDCRANDLPELYS